MGFENDKLLRAVFRATLGGDQQVNVIHYNLDTNDDVPGTESANDPQSLADKLRDDVLPKFKLLYHSSWQIQPVLVQQERDPLDPTAPRESWTSGTVSAGGIVSVTAIARAMCVVASIKTKYVGRRYTGRMFIGGSLGEHEINGDVFENAALVRYQAFLDSIPKQPDISLGPSLATCDWCVFSRTQRAEGKDPYAADVRSAVASNKIHWLRSREA